MGVAPRHFPPELANDLKINKPDWLNADAKDALNTLFLRQKALVRDGRVVGGHITQTNVQLFEAGPNDHPPEVVYSLADPATASHLTLMNIATELFALKAHTTRRGARVHRRISDG